MWHCLSIFVSIFGTFELKREFIVADIEDEGLLGMDILFQGSEGPADILLSESIIRLNGVSIPCIQVGQSDTARKLTVAENFTIPGNSEMLVDVFTERNESDDCRKDSSVLIEPSENFKDKYPLVMASNRYETQRYP